MEDYQKDFFMWFNYYFIGLIVSIIGTPDGSDILCLREYKCWSSWTRNIFKLVPYIISDKLNNDWGPNALPCFSTEVKQVKAKCPDFTSHLLYDFNVISYNHIWWSSLCTAIILKFLKSLICQEVHWKQWVSFVDQNNNSKKFRVKLLQKFPLLDPVTK